MERKFDMDNFEHSLKQHADEFSMVPSKRVWNGVYNSIHPGSKWPSLTMVLFFLLTLVGIGPLNISSKNSSLKALPDNTQNSFKEENETSLFNIKTVPKIEKTVSEKNSVTKVISLKNKVEESSDKIKSSSKNISTPKSEAENISKEAGELTTIQGENIVSSHYELVERSLEKIPNALVINMQDYKRDLATISKESAVEIDHSLPENYTFELKGNFNPDDKRSLAALLKSSPGKPLLIKIENDISDAEFNSPAGPDNASVAIAQKNNKTTWIFFATPSITTTYFTGESFENPNNAINSSPLIVNPNQLRTSMRFNARIGLNLGTEMNHQFSDGWEIVSGAQISFLGYNILAHKVHPTFSYLYLKDGPDLITPHKYITYYGSGLGLDEVVLHNNSLQLSVPVGIKHSVWKNNNVEIKLGASVQPSLLLNGHAYILSTDGRNYVTDDGLMRNVNVIGEFNSSISFQGEKVKWHVGPVVRYQALSTYKKNYPVNEHLVDYGIRIGISK